MLKVFLIHSYHPEHNCTLVSKYILANITSIKNTLTSGMDNRFPYRNKSFLFLKAFLFSLYISKKLE
jgi:hypothetical protein